MDGVTHSFGEPHDEWGNNDWLPMPYYDQLPDEVVGGDLMHCHSFSECMSGLSGLINLQNSQNQGQAELHYLNPAS
jgi:hypothetical protein